MIERSSKIEKECGQRKRERERARENDKKSQTDTDMTRLNIRKGASAH